MAVDSLVSGGCIVSGSKVNRSLLFTGTRIHSYCRHLTRQWCCPMSTSPAPARLTKKVVIDRGVKIYRRGWSWARDPELDAKRFRRSAGGVMSDHPEDDRRVAHVIDA